MDLLAWAVVGLTCFFGFIPIIGNEFSTSGSGYIEDLKLGLVVVTVLFVFAIFAISVIAIVWVFSHVAEIMLTS